MKKIILSKCGKQSNPKGFTPGPPKEASIDRINTFINANILSSHRVAARPLTKCKRMIHTQKEYVKFYHKYIKVQNVH